MLFSLTLWMSFTYMHVSAEREKDFINGQVKTCSSTARTSAKWSVWAAEATLVKRRVEVFWGLDSDGAIEEDMFYAGVILALSPTNIMCLKLRIKAESWYVWAGPAICPIFLGACFCDLSYLSKSFFYHLALCLLSTLSVSDRVHPDLLAGGV